MNAHQRRVKERAKIRAKKKRLEILKKSLMPYQIEAMERLANLPNRSPFDLFQWGRGYSSLRMRMPSLDNLPKPLLIVEPTGWSPAQAEQAVGRLKRGQPEFWLFESDRQAGEVLTIQRSKVRPQISNENFIIKADFKNIIVDEVGEEFKPKPNEGEENGS